MLQEVAATCPSQRATAKSLLDLGGEPATHLPACIRRLEEKRRIPCAARRRTRSVSGPGGLPLHWAGRGKESCHTCSAAAVATAGESGRQLRVRVPGSPDGTVLQEPIPEAARQAPPNRWQSLCSRSTLYANAWCLRGELARAGRPPPPAVTCSLGPVFFSFLALSTVEGQKSILDNTCEAVRTRI